jgi:Domain of unknown function (DUF4111)
MKRLLGDRLVSLYLGGSLSYGDFVPERSDIDLQAVVRSPLTDDEIKSADHLHREIERRYPEWVNRIECSYTPLQLMSEIDPPATPRPWWGFGTMYAEAPAGNEWTINHYLLSKYGIAVCGPEFRTLVPPISVEDVQRASARDLFAEWVPKIDDPSWLANSHYQSYLVLNLCRILYTVVTGEAGSKKTAAEWVKEVYPQWKDLIEEAERWSYGDEMRRQREAIAFVQFAVEKVTGASGSPGQPGGSPDVD